MKRTKSKYITAILIITIIFAFIRTVFAEENIIQNEIENNIVSNRTLSLQEQQNQVKENLSQAMERLEYVESELTRSNGTNSRTRK